jgi:hypothetical protein
MTAIRGAPTTMGQRVRKGSETISACQGETLRGIRLDDGSGSGRWGWNGASRERAPVPRLKVDFVTGRRVCTMGERGPAPYVACAQARHLSEPPRCVHPGRVM